MLCQLKKSLVFVLTLCFSMAVYSSNHRDEYKDAFTLLLASSFGPTERELIVLKNKGTSSWVEHQITMPPTFHYPMYLSSERYENQIRREYVWWQIVTGSPDQLRQRTAFALSQIFVVSRYGGLGKFPDSLASYYDVLVQHAFGNFRDLLQDVTLHPAMGKYLSLMGSKKSDVEKGRFPDENYAREVMQLFTLGLYQLNVDGSVKVVNGEPIPSYSQSDVEELARILTGWTRSEKALVNPMRNTGKQHDFDSKLFLGHRFKQGQTPREDLKQALDILFHHPNLPPHFSRLMIQRLTKSNPSRAYIQRVAQIFKDDGLGVRGDLSAVIKAIILDPEAYEADAIKVKEPLLAMTQLYRTFPPAEGKVVDVRRVYRVTQQGPLRAESVFNFYPPDYRPIGALSDEGLVAPELALLNWNSYTEMVNVMLAYLLQTHKQHQPTALREWLALTGSATSLVNKLDDSLLGGNMSGDMRDILLFHMSKMGKPNNMRKRKRVLQEMLYLTLTSDEYFVQGGKE